MKAVRSRVKAAGLVESKRSMSEKMRRITVTSSLIVISTDQLGNRVVVGEAFIPPLSPFSTAGFWTDL
jgi:hypothetical protein